MIQTIIRRRRPALLSSYTKVTPIQRVNSCNIHTSLIHTQNLLQVLSSAETTVTDSESKHYDINTIIKSEISSLSANIRQLLNTNHPLLETASNYYFTSEGKHIRPLIVLLISKATSLLQKNHSTEEYLIDKPISSLFPPDDRQPTPIQKSNEGTFILPSQRRLAEITEMIHTASLLHDDVIDSSTTRRSVSSANIEFGNKLAILSGDFLLSRASVALARLRHPEVIELLATVISNLVEGEIMQITNDISSNIHSGPSSRLFELYIERIYLKTGSLFAKSCRAAAILGGCSKEVIDLSYTFGRNLGISFQIADDLIDFVGSTAEAGKPVNADLKLGITTIPVLFAWEEHPEMGQLIERNFSNDGDIELARKFVTNGTALKKTESLAHDYASSAVQALDTLPDTQAKQALYDITQEIWKRRK